MKISTLDQMLPKRWNLRFRYYLPFFKKPDPFYFKCREFVNSLKKNGITQDFPLEKLVPFLTILETHSKRNTELVEFSKKIIDTFKKEQLQAIKPDLLKKSLSKYNLKNNDQTPVLNALFEKLSNSENKEEDKNENFILTEKTKEFDIDTELKNILKDKNIETTKKILQEIPDGHRSILINKLIKTFYDSLKIKDTALIEKMEESDFRFQVLDYIYIKDKHKFSLNDAQRLAITSLLNLPFTANNLIGERDEVIQQLKENFSIELQEYLAENRIKALKDFMKENFIEKIKKENTRDGGIHRKFRNFYRDDYPNPGTNPVNELDSIIQKLPMLIKESHEINFIQKLFRFFYELLDSPSVKKIKIKRLVTVERDRIDYETLAEERRELTKRIGIGAQTSVSDQRMEELFGKKQALVMKNKWRKLGITFFNSDNPRERQIALQEAAMNKAVWSNL